MSKKPKTASRTYDAASIWKRQPRDANGRWVKAGTTLSEAIKSTAKKEKLRESYQTHRYEQSEKRHIAERDAMAKAANDRLNKSSFTTSVKPMKIGKNKLKQAVAVSIGKKEAAKLDKDFTEVYKPSTEVAAKLKSKTTSPRIVDKLIDKEAHEPYMKAAKAYLINNDEDSSPKIVKKLAYEYASQARVREYEKIEQITKGEYEFKSKKGNIIETDTEDTYQAKWVNQYKVKDSNENIVDKGLFRTADELKKILEN